MIKEEKLPPMSKINSINEVQKLMRPVRLNLNEGYTIKSTSDLYLKNLTSRNCISKCKGIVQIGSKTKKSLHDNRICMTERENHDNLTKKELIFKKIFTKKINKTSNINMKNGNS